MYFYFKRKYYIARPDPKYYDPKYTSIFMATNKQRHPFQSYWYKIHIHYTAVPFIQLKAFSMSMGSGKTIVVAFFSFDMSFRV